MAKPYYHVERLHEGKWLRISFAESHLSSYCYGYVAAMDSMYPSKPHRIIKTQGDEVNVIHETKGRGRPHIN